MLARLCLFLGTLMGLVMAFGYYMVVLPWFRDYVTSSIYLGE